MKKIIFILLCAALTVIIINSKKTAEYYRQKRAEYLNTAKNVNIAVLWPFEKRKDLYKQGVLLAEEQINAAGGILGKKLILDFYSYNDTKSGLKIIRNIVKNPKYSAAIGFYDTGLTSKAAVICEMYGVILISSGAIGSTITEHKFPHIFRNMANIQTLSKAIITYIKKRDINNIAIVYNTRAISRNIWRYMLEYSDKKNLTVVSSYILTKGMRDYRYYIADIKKKNIGALFFAISRNQAVLFIKNMHEMACKKPIFATDIVDDNYFLEKLGLLANGVITYSMFSPHTKNKKVQNFIREFKSKYKVEPDSWAALGNDAVKVLSYTMKKIKSIRPFSVASMLPFITWSGAVGSYSFNIHGDVQNKKIFFKKVVNGKFIYLEDKNADN